MKWFRRKPDEFDVDWDLHGTRYSPNFPAQPVPFPEPWRDYPGSANCLLLPRSVCLFFADEKKIQDIERQEPEKVHDLRTSIAVEGLKVPLIMTWDDHGKIRYHDGYHRMTAMRVLDDPQVVPVWFRRSEGRVKAYGRQPEDYIEILFSAIDRAITQV